jgi:septal ring factor EnvC (AmiA/AmiB activator)
MLRSERLMGICRVFWLSITAVGLVAAQTPGPVLTTPRSALDTTRADPIQLDREIAQNQQELEQTRRRLGDIQQQLADLDAKEQSSLARIASYEQQINLTRRYLRQIEVQAAARTREIARAARDIQRTESEVKARKGDLGRRLTGIYKYGRLFPLEALLSTRSLPEIYRKMIYLRWMARSDRRLAAELTGLSRRLSQQKSTLVGAQAALDKIKAEQTAQQNSLDSARADEAALLRKVQSGRETGEALRKQLAESANKLEAVIADLQHRRTESGTTDSGAFDTNRGKLLWPVTGRVIAAFGTQIHPRYKTKTNNLGVDIQTQPGAVVQASAAGRVAYADQFMGYGNLIIVDHGSGFYTLYGNLDEISATVGSEVAAGSRIGSAGEYLHFEIRKDGKPVDPADWLKPKP